ncbi:MAG TPA: endolytic transglycosylase MltG [Rhodocyclaceae bacterium]|nr:endolytic transglycosylase MltG [Rhodocyclaceae bacterium]
MRRVSRLILLAVVACAVFCGWLGWFALKPVPLASSPLEFDIRPGLGLRAAAGQMTDAGVGFAPWQFSLLGRLTGKAGEIKAGSYEVSRGITPWDLLKKLTRGDVTQAEIVFVEGRTFRQFRATLDADLNVRHDTLGLTDSEALARIGATETHPEGLFFPDTYLFAKQSSDVDVLRRAYRAMQRRLTVEWESRDPSAPYRTPYQALIMASIVEKETGQPSDRPLVASVFANRLRVGMLLQTDPTVIYGLGDKFDGNLRKRDLTMDTPYNTYTRAGLPPTPIAMPGLASIQAALHPPVTDRLYFVARGDGSSVFSRTLEEHNRAVAKYQRRNGGS